MWLQYEKIFDTKINLHGKFYRNWIELNWINGITKFFLTLYCTCKNELHEGKSVKMWVFVCDWLVNMFVTVIQYCAV